jgi:serine/threonine protein kinase
MLMTNCPTPGQLQQLLEETLPEEEQRVIEPHIEGCAVCRAALDRLTGSSRGPWPMVSLGGPILGLDAARSERHYRLVRFHARGGLGEVFVAEDEEFHRLVAIKILREQHRRDPEAQRRFLEEARITAQLRNPGIVQMYAIAQTDDGRPCYLMSFVEGQTLHEAIQKFHATAQGAGDSRETRMALRHLLSRFVAVCHTVAYAHDQRVLHRDIKPSNILLGRHDETLVLDWGMAKRFGGEKAAPGDGEEPGSAAVADTEASTVMSQGGGTPSYMSPEQAAGPAVEVGPASDIYNLGATLYCLLTGQAPFASHGDGAECNAVLEMVRRGDFPPPRKINARVAPALEAVCLKAMAHRPESRYRSVQALADDLEHWLADEPVSARPEPWWERGQRWVKGHRVLAATGVGAVLVALACFTVATFFLKAAYTRESNLRTLLEKQQVRADANLANGLDVMDFFLETARRKSTLMTKNQEELRTFYLPKLIGFYEAFLQEQDDSYVKARWLTGRVYHGLGVSHALTGNRSDAETNLLQAKAIQEMLAPEFSDPEYGGKYAAALAVTLIDLKRLYAEWGKREASEAVQQDIVGLIDSFPDRRTGGLFFLRVAERLNQLGLYEQALVWLEMLIESMEFLLEKKPDDPRVRLVLRLCLDTYALSLFQLDRHGEALKVWDRRLREYPEPLSAEHRFFRSQSLAREGDYKGAVAEAEDLVKTPDIASEDFYNLACVLALSVKAVNQDARLAQGEREQRAEEYATRAITLLTRSRDDGFFKQPGALEQFKKDADFDSIRKRADFVRFVESLEKSTPKGR